MQIRELCLAWPSEQLHLNLIGVVEGVGLIAYIYQSLWGKACW